MHINPPNHPPSALVSWSQNTPSSSAQFLRLPFQKILNPLACFFFIPKMNCWDTSCFFTCDPVGGGRRGSSPSTREPAPNRLPAPDGMGGGVALQHRWVPRKNASGDSCFTPLYQPFRLSTRLRLPGRSVPCILGGGEATLQVPLSVPCAPSHPASPDVVARLPPSVHYARPTPHGPHSSLNGASHRPRHTNRRRRFGFGPSLRSDSGTPVPPVSCIFIIFFIFLCLHLFFEAPFCNLPSPNNRSHLCVGLGLPCRTSHKATDPKGKPHPPPIRHPLLRAWQRM